MSGGVSVFFFKKKTAYKMRISDWSSDVCSSDLLHSRRLRIDQPDGGALDISAPVPDHFAASLDALGFDPLLGDVLAEEAPRPSAKTVQKAKAKAQDRKSVV